ncbi:adhesion G protein-coupled receptor E2-like [Conger conger]|uniref:adhesion G protein-coupled receptor E2-like n=1 Tax=Conger conger TaxID=82655 RepID=UPI002A5A30C5|nr:adhesion G protein-coupled receptor E2-like [Conger conger]
MVKPAKMNSFHITLLMGSLWYLMGRCYSLGQANGDIRLVNGSQACSGRVELYLGGQWGTVCDDRWGLLDAAVVCRQLGCGDAVSAPHSAYFGKGLEPTWMDEVQCTGVESYLTDCAHIGSAQEDCAHSEDAGVVCSDCGDDLNICGPNAKCINTPQGHNCTCHDGFFVIISGSMPSTSNPCEDVDECAENACGANAECFNTPQSYKCTCLDGYISSGPIWEDGVTVCMSSEEFLASFNPPEGQSPEMFFLSNINKDLEDNPDIVLSEKTVTSFLSMTLSAADMSLVEGKGGTAEVASILLKIIEGLVSALVEPTETQANKSVKTPTMEISAVAIGPEANMTEMPAILAKGNMMAVNLAAVAKNNNGSASAVLMSVNGMEKVLSPSFFESENVTEMYSDIITATLPKTKHKELPEPVNFTVFHKKKFQAGLVTCVYWQEQGKETHWSVDGCTASFSNENHTVCSCTHLSTFALLLQTEEQKKDEDNSLLEVVNLVCMSVGLAFLTLTILTFLLFRWNPKINNTARLHLSISLFLGHLLFLVGVSRTENAVVCAVIAGTLHFLFLSSFVWMLLETLQLFLLVRSLSKVQVIQKEGLRALYLLLIGYGAPLVVVGVSAAVFSGGYGSKDTCWLSKDRNFQWSFIGPVCAILTLNLVSFCAILWSLQPTLANMKSDVSQSKDTRLITFKIAAQFFVLGCSWILGFFQNSVILKYIFIILNSQQGTFIFIVHCLLNKEVREEYRRWLSCLCRTEGPSGGRHKENTLTDSGVSTSSTTKGKEGSG